MNVAELPHVSGELLDLDELAAVRAQSWIARSDRGFEVLTYDRGFEVLEHPQLLKGPTFQYRIDELGLTGDARRYMQMSVPNTEGEYRKRLRQPLTSLFRPSQIAKLREGIRDIARTAVAELDHDGPVDLMERLCWIVPSQTYCDLVSIPREFGPTIKSIGDRILGVLLTVDKDRVHELEAAVAESVEIVKEHLEKRRQNLGDDFTSVMIQQQEAGMLTEEELFVEAFSILQASVDNTAHQMGNTFALLLREPERWRAFVENRDLRGPIIEEAIRLYPRFGTVFRLAPNDVTIGDVDIPGGSWIFVSVRAAQRDPAQFEAPDEYRLDRKNSRKPMFGSGGYNCLGQNLARMEIEEALMAVADAYPEIRLAGDWVRRETNAVSETKQLPVTLR
jgi:Cytochrome P450